MRILSQVYHQDYPFPVGGGWTSLDIEKELERGCGLGIFGEHYQLQSFVIFSRTGDHYEISLLATDREQRRQGQMAFLIQYLHSTWGGGKKLWLEVHENNNAARNLYKKQGFTEEGRRPRYYRDGGDAILYTLR